MNLYQLWVLALRLVAERLHLLANLVKSSLDRKVLIPKLAEVLEGWIALIPIWEIDLNPGCRVPLS